MSYFLFQAFLSLLCIVFHHKGLAFTHISLTTCLMVLGVVMTFVQLTVCTGRHRSEVLCGTGWVAFSLNVVFIASVVVLLSIMTHDYSKVSFGIKKSTIRISLLGFQSFLTQSPLIYKT